MLSRNLETTLHRSLECAQERQHEFTTLEHLLFALTEDQDAVAVLRACDVDVPKLRLELVEYLDSALESLRCRTPQDPKLTEAFQRVLQRAAINVQSAGREEVTGANVLVAMFSERESHAVYFLQNFNMTRFDAVNYISHGITKSMPTTEAPGVSGADEDATADRTVRRGKEALEVLLHQPQHQSEARTG